MKHYTLEQWADFARNVAEPATAVAMRHHLEAGCNACAETRALLQKVTDMASQETEYEPPAELVRSAKSLMPRLHQRPIWAETAEIMELVFDSFRQPALTGVRAASFTARQLLYQKDNCSIDIHLEGQPDRINVIGQVLQTSAPEQSVSAVLVEALHDGKSMGSTSTNQFGEFHLSLPAQGALDLCFGFSSKQCLLVRVPPLESIPEAGKVVDR
jgi:hypothetical protein